MILKTSVCIGSFTCRPTRYIIMGNSGIAESGAGLAISYTNNLVRRESQYLSFLLLKLFYVPFLCVLERGQCDLMICNR